MADRHVASSIINAIVEKTFLSILEGLLLPFSIYSLLKIWPSWGLLTLGHRIPFLSKRLSEARALEEGAWLSSSVDCASNGFNLSEPLFLHLCYGGNNLHHRGIVRVGLNISWEALSTLPGVWGRGIHGSYYYCCRCDLLYPAVLKLQDKKHCAWALVKYLSIFVSYVRYVLV